MRRSTLGVLLLPVLVGCRNEAGAGPGVTTRDSAGIRIVEIHGSAPGSAWSVAARPALDITGGEPGTGPGLYRVMGAARLADGRIVVANGGSNTLEVFAPDGRHERTLGRAGDGPGEFRALSWVGRASEDSIAAWDSAPGRLSVFTPQGGYARSVAPRQPLGVFPQVQGELADGAVLLVLHQPTLGMATTSDVHVQRDTISLAVLHPDGGVNLLGRFPGTEVLASGSPAGGLMMMPLPFGRQTVAAARGGRVYAATGERWEVAEYAAEGGLRALIRADRNRRPVTRSDVRKYRESVVMLGGEGNAALSRQRAQLLARAPYPGRKPAITALRVDAEGNLWVESPAAEEGAMGGEWAVVSPAGRVLGRVRLPDGLAVQQVGPGWLLGTAAEGGVEHVRLYRFTRRR
jgi:hypothetical protein